LAQQGKINLLLSHNLTNIHGNDYLSHVETTNKEKEVIATDADYFIPYMVLRRSLVQSQIGD
jgi:thioredoxin reductase (NADPH)